MHDTTGAGDSTCVSTTGDDSTASGSTLSGVASAAMSSDALLAMRSLFFCVGWEVKEPAVRDRPPRHARGWGHLSAGRADRTEVLVLVD